MYLPLHEGHTETATATSGLGTELIISVVIGLVLLAALAYVILPRLSVSDSY